MREIKEKIGFSLLVVGSLGLVALGVCLLYWILTESIWVGGFFIFLVVALVGAALLS